MFKRPTYFIAQDSLPKITKHTTQVCTVATNIRSLVLKTVTSNRNASKTFGLMCKVESWLNNTKVYINYDTTRSQSSVTGRCIIRSLSESWDKTPVSCHKGYCVTAPNRASSTYELDSVWRALKWKMMNYYETTGTDSSNWRPSTLRSQQQYVQGKRTTKQTG